MYIILNIATEETAGHLSFARRLVSGDVLFQGLPRGVIFLWLGFKHLETAVS